MRVACRVYIVFPSTPCLESYCSKQALKSFLISQPERTNADEHESCDAVPLYHLRPHAREVQPCAKGDPRVIIAAAD